MKNKQVIELLNQVLENDYYLTLWLRNKISSEDVLELYISGQLKEEE